MTLEAKRRAGLYAGIAILALLLIRLCIWVFSRPRTPLEYLVAGTVATAILLAAAFVQIVKRGYLGPIRRGDGGAGKPRSPVA